MFEEHESPIEIKLGLGLIFGRMIIFFDLIMVVILREMMFLITMIKRNR